MSPIFRSLWVRAALVSVVGMSSFGFLPSAMSDPTKSASYTEAFPTVPESKWIGLRLLILPQSKALQRYGYQELYQDVSQKAVPEYVPLRYEDYVGRIVRVVGIGRGNVPHEEPVDEADLQLEGDKKIIHGDIDHGCMNDVAPVSDLENARKLYLSKTLWLSSDHVNTYDPQKDTEEVPASPDWHAAFQKIRIKQFSPMKVIDIVPGWYASAPTRFIVQEPSGPAGAEGAKGYVDVHMSDTNVPEKLKAFDRFENTFLESDPRTKYRWSTKVWSALENRQVFPGMTSQQVRMSWGAPKEVHQPVAQNDTEQWIYDSTHVLILRKGKLEAVSTHPLTEK